MPGARAVTERSHAVVREGHMMTMQWVIEDIAVGSTVDILFDLSAAAGKKLNLYETRFLVTAGTAVARFYLPGDFDSGTAIQIPLYNRDEVNGKPVLSKAYYKTDGVTVPGTAGDQKYQIGTGTSPQSAGGSGGDGFPSIIDPSISRLLRIVHTGGTTTFNLELRLVFSEEDYSPV